MVAFVWAWHHRQKFPFPMKSQFLRVISAPGVYPDNTSMQEPADDSTFVFSKYSVLQLPVLMPYLFSENIAVSFTLTSL